MDLIQLYQAGIINVVAASGTALTERHVQQIKKFTNRAYLAYDGDQAGKDAAIRAGYLLYQSGVEPLIIKVPDDKDPDDWVREEGADIIRKTAKTAQPLIDFELESKQVEQLSAPQQSELVNNILFNIARIKDSIIRNSILKSIAQHVAIDESELMQKIKNEQSRQRINIKPDKVENKNIEFTSQIQKAQLILTQFLASDDLKVRQIVRENIDVELFTEPLLKQLAGILMPLYNDISFSSIIDQFDEKYEKEVITKILMDDVPLDDPKKQVKECMGKLRSINIKEKIKALKFKIRELESQGKDPMEAVIEEAQLRQELKELD